MRSDFTDANYSAAWIHVDSLHESSPFPRSRTPLFFSHLLDYMRHTTMAVCKTPIVAIRLTIGKLVGIDHYFPEKATLTQIGLHVYRSAAHFFFTCGSFVWSPFSSQIVVEMNVDALSALYSSRQEKRVAKVGLALLLGGVVSYGIEVMNCACSTNYPGGLTVYPMLAMAIVTGSFFGMKYQDSVQKESLLKDFNLAAITKVRDQLLKAKNNPTKQVQADLIQNFDHLELALGSQLSTWDKARFDRLFNPWSLQGIALPEVISRMDKALDYLEGFALAQVKELGEKLQRVSQLGVENAKMWAELQEAVAKQKTACAQLKNALRQQPSGKVKKD